MLCILSLGKWITTGVHHYGVLQNCVTALKLLCAIPTHPSLPQPHSSYFGSVSLEKPDPHNPFLILFSQIWRNRCEINLRIQLDHHWIFQLLGYKEKRKRRKKKASTILGSGRATNIATSLCKDPTSIPLQAELSG